jgi:Arc/MetJ-type ribon-helix-helix transcriptional regulator
VSSICEYHHKAVQTWLQKRKRKEKRKKRKKEREKEKEKEIFFEQFKCV